MERWCFRVGSRAPEEVSEAVSDRLSNDVGRRVRYNVFRFWRDGPGRYRHEQKGGEVRMAKKLNIEVEYCTL